MMKGKFFIKQPAEQTFRPLKITPKLAFREHRKHCTTGHFILKIIIKKEGKENENNQQ